MQTPIPTGRATERGRHAWGLPEVLLQLLHDDEDYGDSGHHTAEVGPEPVIQRHDTLRFRGLDEAVDHAGIQFARAILARRLPHDPRLHNVERAARHRRNVAGRESGADGQRQAIRHADLGLELPFDLVVSREFGCRQRSRAAHSWTDACPQTQHALFLDDREEGVDHPFIPLGQQLPLRVLHHAVRLEPHFHQVRRVGHSGGHGARSAARDNLFPQRDGLPGCDAHRVLDRRVQPVAQAAVRRLADQRGGESHEESAGALGCAQLLGAVKRAGVLLDTAAPVHLEASLHDVDRHRDRLRDARGEAAVDEAFQNTA
mmetsp:Transcript_27274/g.65930  ORF Transcript_27274/g.65930 Transcript_27274/m.65930 type:complete len:316 (+) Transcript_27274:325-1272(+)